MTILFYGDSITYGASATYLTGYNPKQYTFPMLFTQALADLFDYTVHYEKGVAQMPKEDYVAGVLGADPEASIAIVSTMVPNPNATNDFFVRVYAQTLLQAVVGYENMQ